MDGRTQHSPSFPASSCRLCVVGVLGMGNADRSLVAPLLVVVPCSPRSPPPPVFAADPLVVGDDDQEEAVASEAT